ncbi:hypothetical protein AB1Y20_012242 [Prymnesium parvum]|uniref:Uncharacterized protein n=1 Tax=Prymnesium parvum TaxID=97485 RepID=A0AB34IQP1_PRYPA
MPQSHHQVINSPIPLIARPTLDAPPPLAPTHTRPDSTSSRPSSPKSSPSCATCAQRKVVVTPTSGNYKNKSSDSDSSDASDTSSAPSRATSVAEAPLPVKRDDDSPATARPPSQRRRKSSRPSGVQVHPAGPTAAAVPEPTPPSAQLPASARRSVANAASAAPSERLVKADLHRLSTALEPPKIQRWIG